MEQKAYQKNSKLKNAIEKSGIDFNSWLENFKMLAMTRGVGWAMLYYDKETDNFNN